MKHDRKRNLAMFDNPSRHFHMGVRPTQDGFQSLVVIDNVDAPRSYTFPVRAPRGSRLQHARERGIPTDDVFLLEPDGKVRGIFAPAWAKDARGRGVPTQYLINGMNLTQEVNFSSSTAFPVVADPEYVKILKCAGVITIAIGAAIVPGGAIVRFISKVGSVAKAAKIFVRALKAARPGAKEKAIRDLLLSVGGSMIGVTTIVEACS